MSDIFQKKKKKNSFPLIIYGCAVPHKSKGGLLNGSTSSQPILPSFNIWFLPFLTAINPTSEICTLHQVTSDNVIYFDLAHGVTTTLTPTLLFGGQVISSEPTKHRAEEEIDKKLIEQANYVKWSSVADTSHQFTLKHIWLWASAVLLLSRSHFGKCTV